MPDQEPAEHAIERLRAALGRRERDLDEAQTVVNRLLAEVDQLRALLAEEQTDEGDGDLLSDLAAAYLRVCEERDELRAAHFILVNDYRLAVERLQDDPLHLTTPLPSGDNPLHA